MRKIALFFLALLLCSLPALATEYYVSQVDGSDSYNGLYSTYQSGTDGPWLTIAKVNAQSFNADDIIYFRCNGVWDDSELLPPSSGSSGQPIIFTAYGTGSPPLITCMDDVIGSTGDWSDQGSNVWRRSLTTECQHTIFDSTNRGVEDASPDSDYEWDWVSSYLYVYAEGNPASYYSSIEAAQRDCGVYTSSKSFYTIDGIDFRGGNLSCIYVFGGQHVTITDCVITYGSLDGIRFASTASYGIADSCTISYVNSCGVNIGSSCTAGFEVTDNTIHHYGQDPAVQYAQGITSYATSATISGNTIYSQPAANTNGYGHGIYINRATDETTVSGNTVHDILNGNGIKVKADGGDTSCIVKRNHVYDCRNAGILIERAYNTDTLNVGLYYNICTGSHYGIALTNTYTQTFNCWIYNNVMYKNIDTDVDAYPMEMRIMNDPDTLVVKNNIFFGVGGTTYKEFEVDGTLSGETIDYNCYYLATFYYGGASRTWSYWTGTLGYDTPNGMNDDPEFDDGDGDDFHIGSSSPCKDAGDDVSLSMDYYGNVVPYNSIPDIGVHEYAPEAEGYIQRVIIISSINPISRRFLWMHP